MVEMKGRIGEEGKSNWLLFKHKDEYADEEWTLKPILNYGSRTQAPTAKKKADVGARALERLVKKSKTRRSGVPARQSLRRVKKSGEDSAPLVRSRPMRKA